MPLLNYTTEVPASRSIAEITRILQEGGASAIMLENDPGTSSITAISFMMQTTFGRIPFSIPAKVGAVIAMINVQITEETKRVNQSVRYKRKIPRSIYNDKAQAERIAWRIAKDWIEVQLAMAQIGNAKFEQIMMPFAMLNGKSFYERMAERGSLALPAPKDEPKDANEIEVG